MCLGGATLQDGVSGNGHFVNVFLIWQDEHGIQQGLLNDGTQAACAGFAADGFLRNGLQRFRRKFERYVFITEDFLE